MTALELILLAAALLTAAYLGYRGYRRWQARRRREFEAVLVACRKKLDSEQLDDRLGAVSRLDRAAKEGARAYRQVAEVLCGFLRERTDPAAEKTSNETIGESRGVTLPPDIQLALSVLAGRGPEVTADEPPLDLSEMGLNRAGLPGARLGGAKLHNACLMAAELWKADLRDADLSGVRLEGANMSEALLDGADLTGASLGSANLEHASLRGADLWGADLTDAKLTLAHLEGANLSKVVGLTSAQLESAYRNESTELPDAVG